MNSTRLTRHELLTRSAAGLAALGLTGTSTVTDALAASTASTASVPFYTVESDPPSIVWLNQAAASYQAHGHPDFRLDEVVLNDSNRLERELIGFSTKTDLGIFTVAQPYIETWVNAGYLLPLDRVVQSIGPSDFLPGLRVVLNGHDWVMPYQVNAYSLWCRTDLLAKVGMQPPRTYDEWLAAAKALTRNGTYGVAMPVAPDATTLNFFSPFVYQSGWDYFDKEGNVTFAQPEVLDGVKRFVNLMRYAPPQLYNGTFIDVINSYIAGRVAMGVYPGRLGANLVAKAPALAEHTTVVPVPAGPFMTGKILNSNIGYYAIDRATRYPAEALDFLKYISTGQQQLAWGMTVPGQLLPFLKSVEHLLQHYHSPFMNKYGAWVRSQASWVSNGLAAQLNMGSVNNGHFKKIVNFCPWASKVWGTTTLDGNMLQEILLNGQAPEAAWKSASQQMKKIVADYKRANPSWHPTA